MDTRYVTTDPTPEPLPTTVVVLWHLPTLCPVHSPQYRKNKLPRTAANVIDLPKCTPSLLGSL